MYADAQFIYLFIYCFYYNIIKNLTRKIMGITKNNNSKNSKLFRTHYSNKNLEGNVLNNHGKNMPNYYKNVNVSKTRFHFLCIFLCSREIHPELYPQSLCLRRILKNKSLTRTF